MDNCLYDLLLKINQYLKCHLGLVLVNSLYYTLACKLNQIITINYILNTSSSLYILNNL